MEPLRSAEFPQQSEHAAAFGRRCEQRPPCLHGLLDFFIESAVAGSARNQPRQRLVIAVIAPRVTPPSPLYPPYYTN